MNKPKPIYAIGDKTPTGQTVSDVLPVIYGSEPVDYIYELDGDFNQRWNTDELTNLITKQ